MKKSEIISLYRSLNSLGDMKGPKFSYGVVKNIKMMQSEIEAIEKALVSDEAYNTFETERIELAKKFAEKDEKGLPKMQISKQNPQTNEFIIEDAEGFKTAIKELQIKHKEVIDKREAFLNEDANIGMFHKVLIEDVPKEISAQQLNSIFEIIAE